MGNFHNIWIHQHPFLSSCVQYGYCNPLETKPLLLTPHSLLLLTPLLRDGPFCQLLQECLTSASLFKLIYFEIYLCLLAQCGVSLHTSEPSIGDVLPDVKGLRGNFEGGENDTRQKACYMKSHNAEILSFSKA